MLLFLRDHRTRARRWRSGGGTVSHFPRFVAHDAAEIRLMETCDMRPVLKAVERSMREQQCKYATNLRIQRQNLYRLVTSLLRSKDADMPTTYDVFTHSKMQSERYAGLEMMQALPVRCHHGLQATFRMPGLAATNSRSMCGRAMYIFATTDEELGN
jgi:hypothetical protein